MRPVLSILICSLPERKESLDRLLKILDCQIRNCKSEVEYLVDCTPRGIVTTGTKRNHLLEKAHGRYVAYIDDDDIVSLDYVKRILAATDGDPDCVGMVGILSRQFKPDWTFRHSITVSRWCKDKENRIYYRTPNHLNPIKKMLADIVGFKDITISEDRDYSDRIKPLLKTETFIESPIYFYLK
jgi:glycosyltransferase involved in cell wall biosynthesis